MILDYSCTQTVKSKLVLPIVKEVTSNQCHGCTMKASALKIAYQRELGKKETAIHFFCLWFTAPCLNNSVTKTESCFGSDYVWPINKDWSWCWALHSVQTHSVSSRLPLWNRFRSLALTRILLGSHFTGCGFACEGRFPGRKWTSEPLVRQPERKLGWGSCSHYNTSLQNIPQCGAGWKCFYLLAL